ncbi:mechanosensitive ion channel family protein [Chloroflexota bacterium]
MNDYSIKQLFFDVVLPLVIFIATLLIGHYLRKLFFNRLKLLGKRTKRQFFKLVIDSTMGPSLIWFLMLAIYLALEISKLPENLVDIVGKILLVLSIISMTLVISSVAVAFIQFQAKRAKTVTPVTSLMENAARIFIYILGILIIIYILNIQLTPILATLGIGGLAVALALQGTLADLFAGFYISASKQIRVGDWVKLESGEEGYVTDITWRATQIRMLPNNLILVPNDKLSKAIVINYYFPQKEMAVYVNVGVHYGSDLEKVELVTIEVAKEVMKEVEGGVPGFEPFIRYRTFGDFSINLTVILRASEVIHQYLITHEFIKRLHKRYKDESIVIPFPIRAINYDQEQTEQEIR